MRLSTPRLVIAGLSGDSGKTLVSLGMIRALTSRGLGVAPVKKGPDYIDAAWLGAAGRRPGRNLDTFLMSPAAIGEGLARSQPADLVLVEGNRGLYDGLDAAGSHSTAVLAKLLQAPVVLVIDATKMTRTTAALVQGCTAFDPEVRIAGVVLNRVGTARQERIIREAIAVAGGPPVLGAIPRVVGDLLPGRHLGLVTVAEHPRRNEAMDRAAMLVEEHVDLEAALEAARSASPVELPDLPREDAGPPVRIGVFRDEALSFYYPENLEALVRAGATLVTISPLNDRELPEVDALYFGGGFPETHVDRLADNRLMREAVRRAALDGIPVYAECGGLMYLADELLVDGVARPMVGALDLVVEQTARPQGHGYVEAEVDRDNPFYTVGTRLRGHEFHYSKAVSGSDLTASALRLGRGRGLGDRRDGVAKGNIWASYLHVHALGTPTWAGALVGLAADYRDAREARRSAEGETPSPGPAGHGPVSGQEGGGTQHGSQRGGHGALAARA